MKTNIRRGVFETNSSSVHAISIIKDNYACTIPKEFTINCNGEYGWEEATYNRPDDKAAYLYQAIVNYPTYNYGGAAKMPVDKKKTILQNLIDKFITNLESFGINVKCEYRYVKAEHHTYSYERNGKILYSDYDTIHFVNIHGDCNSGYLDHGGEAKDFVDFVLSSPDNTLKFIFDSRCFIDTGNDNDDNYVGNTEYNYEDSVIFRKGN